MNKKSVISIIILGLVLCVLFLSGIIYRKYSINKRYEKIKIEIEEETTKYLKIAHPYCTPGSGSFTLNEDTLLVQWAMDKKKLLDVDGKSYCKVRIEVMCVTQNELDMEVYLKCKDYEDENYSNWEERHRFIGTIIEISDNAIIVEPIEGSHERKSSDKIIMKRMNTADYVLGDKVKITYNGLINESSPAQISATEIELIK